jgi:malonyl-CoA O-methyltransferase
MDQRHLSVEEGYDAWSAVYDHDGNPLMAMEGPVVQRWLADASGRRVVDVGCGTGRHSLWAAEHGAEVTALDVSNGMMAKARGKLSDGHSIRFIRHQLPEPLPLPDASQDIAIFALVSEHIEELVPVFADMGRVLVPGGSAIFTALHPAMNLRGISARFFDPDTGAEVRVRAFHHKFGHYVMSALHGGFTIDEIVEQSVDEKLAASIPRAAKYLAYPMLLAMRLIKEA